MKLQNIAVNILAAVFVCAATQLSVEAALPTVEPVTRFGPSVFGIEIYAADINSHGDIAGYMENINQEGDPDQGFVRFRSGTYLIIDPPNSIPGYTTVSGI